MKDMTWNFSVWCRLYNRAKSLCCKYEICHSCLWTGKGSLDITETSKLIYFLQQ